MIQKANGRPVRCAIYTRVSTADQAAGDFSSLDNQREAAEAYIASQRENGWQALPDRYDDGGYSGGTLERPALERLLRDVAAGLIDVVVVYKIDRLSRSLLDFAQITEQLECGGASFVSITQQIDTSGSTGKLLLNILLSFAQFEREMIAERTRDKMVAARKRGRWTGGPPPLGYHVHPDGGKLDVNEDEAEQVRGIFELYLECGSLSATAKALEQRGWRTKTWRTRAGHLRHGKPFNKNGIGRLLANPLYIGKLAHGGKVYEGQHEAIVPEELYERVQAQLRKNSVAGGAVAKNKLGFLLRGLLRCAACDAAMTPSSTSKGHRVYRYYLCCSAQRHGFASCPAPSLPAGEIEEAVVEQISVIGQDEALVDEVLRAAQAQLTAERAQAEAELGVLRRELTALREEEKRVLAAAGPAGPGSAARAARLAELGRAIEEAQGRLPGALERLEGLEGRQLDPAALRRTLAEFGPIWGALLPTERARVLGLLLEGVDYHGGTQRLGLSFRAVGLAGLGEEPSAEEAVAL